MIERQLRRRGIRAERVLQVMARVPRDAFIPAEKRDAAYADEALPIDCGQTISQPFMVALMTQTLELSGTEHVLEIGTGSGYQTAVLAEMAADVVSVERHERLSRQAGLALAPLGYDNVRLIVGDGTLGDADRAPFDRILVTAAAASCPPALIEQLADGGMLVAPIGPRSAQTLTTIRRQGDHLITHESIGCRFVPLIGAQSESDRALR